MERRNESGAGGASRSVHEPVLAAEVVRFLGADSPNELEGWIVDGTLGAGGHSRALLAALPRVQLLGLDQDPEILAHARENLAPFGRRVQVRRARFSQLGAALDAVGARRVVGILLDIGASSLQLDSAGRGFSFHADGPLDMRMDPERERTAADIVNGWDESDLADLFFYEGGETRSRKIARAIVLCESADAERRRIVGLDGDCERWILPDPAAVTGTRQARLAAFRAVRDELARRIDAFVAQPRRLATRARRRRNSSS